MKLLLDAKASLGEGPVWDPVRKVLYWVDILAHQIHIYDPADGSDRVLSVDQPVGAVALTASGGLIAALQHGFFHVDLDDASLTHIASIPADHSIRFNDGKCDAAGRFWAGTMDLAEANPIGSLYRLEAPNHLRAMVPGVTISNGLGWSPDNREMYFIDSPIRQVFRFDFDLAQGTLSNRQVIVELREEEGLPDGMTVDAQGMIWIAHWAGSKVSRWNPATGERLQEIHLPCSRVTSCTFGGDDLDDLYITTARVGLTEEALIAEPHAGGLFRVKVDVKGMPVNRFAR